MNKFLYILFFALTLFAFCNSCATVSSVKKNKKKTYAVQYDKFFKKCASMDGSSRFNMYYEGNMYAYFELDWISDATGNWKSDVSTPIGELLMKLNYDVKKNKLEIIPSSILPEENIPDISVDEKGVLSVSGNSLGFKAADVPCMLDYSLPNRWKQSKKIKINFKDLKLNKVCADIKRPRFFGLFSSTSQLCYNFSAPKTATFEGMGDYVFQWLNLDN